ncbi:MAG: BrnT family toxin [Neorhizobium sp.]|nr:BrnT family toxin [Neorhizobium sp.]
MEFEFNAEKSASNKDKHGIDFVEAQALWLDEWLFSHPVAAHDEIRYIVTGRIGQKLWTAVITMRDDRLRIISVRRARKDERRNYEDNHGGRV